MARALHEKPELTNARADFYGRMAAQNMTPLWEVLHTLLAVEPVTDATPHKWDYDLCRPYIMESADIISAEEAERRVMVLENPTLEGRSCITEALYAGLQLIMP
ncbi:MAG: gentisate 1,2-dioxygenase, partial [Alphaproteobacteria bacterium]